MEFDELNEKVEYESVPDVDPLDLSCGRLRRSCVGDVRIPSQDEFSAQDCHSRRLSSADAGLSGHGKTNISGHAQHRLGEVSFDNT